MKDNKKIFKFKKNQKSINTNIFNKSKKLQKTSKIEIIYRLLKQNNNNLKNYYGNTLTSLKNEKTTEKYLLKTFFKWSEDTDYAIDNNIEIIVGTNFYKDISNFKKQKKKEIIEKEKKPKSKIDLKIFFNKLFSNYKNNREKKNSCKKIIEDKKLKTSILEIDIKDSFIKKRNNDFNIEEREIDAIENDLDSLVYEKSNRSIINNFDGFFCIKNKSNQKLIKNTCSTVEY